MNDVRRFFEKHYRPNNAVLVISGDIDLKNAEREVRKYFSGIPPGSLDGLSVDFQDAPLQEENIKIMYGDVPSPAVIAAYKVAPEGSEEYYAFNQIARILSDGNSSRLYKRLVYERQVVSNFDADIEGLEEAGIFTFSGFAAPGHDVKEVLGIFDKEVARLQDSLVGNYEFEKARNSTVSSYVGRLSSNSGVADALAHYQTIFTDAGLINSEVDRELAVTPAAIRDAAQKFLHKESRALIFYYPREQGNAAESDR